MPQTNGISINSDFFCVSIVAYEALRQTGFSFYLKMVHITKETTVPVVCYVYDVDVDRALKPILYLKVFVI